MSWPSPNMCDTVNIACVHAEAWKADPNPSKLNLGVGAYRTEVGVRACGLCCIEALSPHQHDPGGAAQCASSARSRRCCAMCMGVSSTWAWEPTGLRWVSAQGGMPHAACAAFLADTPQHDPGSADCMRSAHGHVPATLDMRDCCPGGSSSVLLTGSDMIRPATAV